MFYYEMCQCEFDELVFVEFQQAQTNSAHCWKVICISSSVCSDEIHRLNMFTKFIRIIRIHLTDIVSIII